MQFFFLSLMPCISFSSVTNVLLVVTRPFLVCKLYVFRSLLIFLYSFSCNKNFFNICFNCV